MKKTPAQKAFELLEDLAFENLRPHDPSDERWIALDSFDPMHGKTEVTYALYKGFIERDDREHGYVRLTPYGRVHLDRKRRQARRQIEEAQRSEADERSQGNETVA